MNFHGSKNHKELLNSTSVCTLPLKQFYSLAHDLKVLFDRRNSIKLDILMNYPQ